MYSRSRRNQVNRKHMQMESLEDRRVLAATVLVAESTFVPQQFTENVSAYLDSNVVGHAHSVSHQGQAAVSSATGGLDGADAGFARTVADSSPTSFEIDTKMEVASVSKVLTTIGVLHALENNTDDLASALNTPISEYLPSSWIMGPNANQITILHLLTHSSGLFEQPSSPGAPGNPIGIDFNTFGNNSMFSLRVLLEAGVGIPTVSLPNGEIGWNRSYNNANFSLLAKMLPYMITDDPGAIATLDLLGAAPTGVADAAFGQIYRDYMRTHVFEPSGVMDADLNVTDPNPALGYFFPTAEMVPGFEQGDFLGLGGAFGWKLSAVELANVLNALQNGSLISSNALSLMNDPNFVLGWDATDSFVPTSDEFGSYLSHGGSASAGLPIIQQGFRSQIVVFPGDVQAALVINNDTNTDFVDESRFELMRESYKDAWTHLVVAGDDADNVFRLRRSTTDTNSLELIEGQGDTANVVFSSPIDVLQSLEIRGMDGDDLFFIEDLPSHIDLVIDGGNDDDEFRLSNPDNNAVFDDIEGSIALLGGLGEDELELDDYNGLSGWYSLTALNNDQIFVDTILDAASYPAPSIFQFGNLEAVTLRANIGSNTITVDGVHQGTELFLYGDSGNDTISVRDVRSDALVEIHGEFDADTMFVSEVAASAQVNVFGDVVGFAGNADSLTVGGGNLDEVRGSVTFEGEGGSDTLTLDHTTSEGIEIHFEHDVVLGGMSSTFGSVEYELVEDVVFQGSSFGDSVQVTELDSRVDLELFGNAGSDRFYMGRVSNQTLLPIEGEVTVHGESGWNPNGDAGEIVDNDRLFVFDGQTSVNGDFEIQTIGAVGSIVKHTPDDGEVFWLTYDQVERTELHTDDVGNHIDVFAVPMFNQFTIYAGGGDDLIDVHSTPANTQALQVHAEDGADRIRISPDDRNLIHLQSNVQVLGGAEGGDGDELEIYDTLSGNTATYRLNSTHFMRPGSSRIRYDDIELLTARLSAEDNLINVTGTAPGTTVLVLGFAGDDHISARNLASEVHFHGGSDEDSARLLGTSQHDEVIVQGNTMTLGAGSLTTIAEHRTFHGRAGADTIQLVGVANAAEHFEIYPAQQRFRGTIAITGQTSLDYISTANVSVAGNAGDGDTLAMHGRTSPNFLLGGSYRDRFDVHLSAAGTAADPVATLKNFNGRIRYLTLEDFSNVGTPTLDGLFGNDTFRLQASNDGTIDRSVRVVGGGGADWLFMNYGVEGADLDWNPVSADDGTIDLAYLELVYGIEYEDIENIAFATL